MDVQRASIRYGADERVQASAFQRAALRVGESPGGVVFPGLVACAGVLLSVGAWNALRSYEEESLQSTLETNSSELARLIESRINGEINELKDLGLTWSEFGTGDLNRWEAEAKFFIKRSGEFLAIEWDSKPPRPNGPLTFATSEGLEILATLSDDPPVVRDRERALESGVETLLGPFTTDYGEACELIFPIQQGKSSVMVLTAILQPDALLESVLSHRASDCALTVRAADGSILYRRGEPAVEGDAERTSDEAIRVLSKEWRLSVQPSAPMLHSLHLRFPWIVLGAGTILSILVASMIRLGMTSLTGTHRLRETSTELEGRIREMERADEQSRVLTERNAGLREERRMLTEEIASLKAELASRAQNHQDSAVAELEAFTYSVSHDLRSPMGAILNYSAVLAEDYRDQLGDVGCDHLSRISSSARTAVAMMDGLLAFSRVGRQELRFGRVDVRGLVREVYHDLCEAMPAKPPELSVGEVPPIQADPTLLRVLFTNLVSNAFKFTRSVESPRIEVGGYGQGSDTVYYVEDNGVGFDMRNAGKLFGVFERLHPTDEYEGHGVGLAIVERIVRRHGGTVRAEGVLGKGATFFVTLPNEPAGNSVASHGRHAS